MAFALISRAGLNDAPRHATASLVGMRNVTYLNFKLRDATLSHIFFVAPQEKTRMTMMIRRGARSCLALRRWSTCSHTKSLHASSILLGDALDMADTFARRHCKFDIATTPRHYE